MMRRARRGRTARSAPIAAAAGIGSVLVMLGIAPLGAETTGGDTVTVEGKPHGYTVTVPAGCRREAGPGTIDAICASDFDAEKSAGANAASALVLSVAAAPLDGAGDASIAALEQRYTEAGFKEELPEAVCGEQDRTRVTIENIARRVEDGRLVYTADVVCAEIRFLQIGPRRALVRHVIGPDAAYHLIARGPADEFEKDRPAIDAFLSSFRPSTEK